MTSHPFTPAFRDADSALDLLSAERHRAKNTLQVVSSLLSLQTRELHDPAVRVLFQSAQDRVQIIALLYERLSRGVPQVKLDFAEALKEILALVVRAHPSPAVSAQVFADALQVELDTAVPLALITYELLCDALSYAFVGRASGRLEVALTVPSALTECMLTITDDGIARSPWASTHSDPFRSKIVDVLLRQLKARLTLESVSGTRLAIRFPFVS